MMKIKRYFIRVVKSIFCIYALLLLIYGLMYFFEVVPPSTIHLFSRKLTTGILLLGLVYPFIGFKCIVVDMPSGGRGAHEQKVCESVEINGFRIEQKQDNQITFVAVSKIRRIFALYEERITLKFLNSTTVSISGLRKDVARIQLRLNDYIRYAQSNSL